MSTFQIVCATIAALAAVIAASVAIADRLIAKGRWGGSKDTVVERLEKAVEKAGEQVTAKFDVITSKLGQQDVTLAQHGQQLVALSKRMDDFVQMSSPPAHSGRKRASTR